MGRIRLLIAITVAVLELGTVRAEDKIAVNRIATVVATAPLKDRIAKKGDVYQMRVHLETSFFYSFTDEFIPRHDSGEPADPFAAPPSAHDKGESEEAYKFARKRRHHLHPKEFFEALDIEFSEKSSVTYDTDQSILTLNLPLEELRKVDSMFAIYEAERARDISVQCQIFEMSIAHANQLLESTGRHYDHTPEKKAALKGTELITMFHLNCKSGERLGVFHHKRSEEPKSNLEQTDKDEPAFQISPIIGPEGDVIDITLSLTLNVEGKYSGELVNQFSMRNRSTIMAGSWSPSYAADKVHMVFITTNTFSLFPIEFLKP
ncbi:MAG: hypothetical protein AAF226_10135 [Verrucomicrobiota bacterium]